MYVCVGVTSLSHHLCLCFCFSFFFSLFLGKFGGRFKHYSQGSSTGDGWQGDEAAVFLPTTALSMFKVLHKCFPKHQLLLADFDELPGSVPGRNAPVVSGPGRRDYNSYLIGMGAADIFFPTDFSLLQTIYQRRL